MITLEWPQPWFIVATGWCERASVNNTYSCLFGTQGTAQSLCDHPVVTSYSYFQVHCTGWCARASWFIVQNEISRKVYLRPYKCSKPLRSSCIFPSTLYRMMWKQQIGDLIAKLIWHPTLFQSLWDHWSSCGDSKYIVRDDVHVGIKLGIWQQTHQILFNYTGCS